MPKGRFTNCEIFFVVKCLDCGEGGERIHVGHDVYSFTAKGRTFTFSDVMEYELYNYLTSVNGMIYNSKLTGDLYKQLSVEDRVTLMIHAHWILCELIDMGVIMVLNDSRERAV